MSYPLSEPSLSPYTCKCKRVCACTAARVEMIWLRAPTLAVWSQNGRPPSSGFLRGGRQHPGCLIQRSGYCYKSIALRAQRSRIGVAPSLHPPPGGTLFFDEAADVFWLHLGELALLPVTSRLTLGWDPHSAPSSTHSLLISLSYRLPASPIYYLSATVHDSECNSHGE